MAKINNFIYCLNVNTEDGRTGVVDVLNAITPENIPGIFSFVINFELLDISEGEHSLDLIFKNPDNIVINAIENATISYIKDENSNLPDEQTGINLAVGMQDIEFKKSGMYSTEVIFDGISMGKYDIYAIGKNE